MTSKHWALIGGAIARLKPLMMFAPLVLSPPAQAQEPQTSLAFPGYSGFLNVPSATALQFGQADVQWSDQVFLSSRRGFEGGRYGHLNNVSGAFGIFPLVEVGGRLTWDKTNANCFTDGCGIRDLSANVKIQAPLIPRDWFSLAAGVQDLGGETDDFEAVYVVAGKRLGPVELTVGFGAPQETPRYLDGAFGALAYTPFEGVTVMAEHDGSDARLGLGLASPEGWLPIGMQLKGKVLAWDDGPTASDRTFASLGLSIPFGNASSKKRLLERPEYVRAQAADEITTGSGFLPAKNGDALSVEANDSRGKEIARGIGEALVSDGYERVKTASRGDTLFVHWENNLYNRDERDSILAVARKAHRAAGTHSKAELTLLNQGLPVLTQTVSLVDDEPYSVTRQFSDPAYFGQQEAGWDFSGSYGPVWKPRLTLSPSVSSGVATEYGVLDSSVALSSELSFSLWPGALASARYNAEVYQTDDFERGGVFYNSRQRTDLIEAEIQQAFKLHPLLLTSFHAGRYAIDYNGALNETLLLSPGGRHAIGFLGGTFRHRDRAALDTDQRLAQYSYYNPELDTQVTIYGGEFFTRDSGFRIDSRFWFGDYALTLQYKNTDAEFISLGWVIPLTPEKDHQFRYLQVKGDADWNYSVQTRINEDRNILSFGGAGIVNSGNPLREVYLNRGRLAH